MTTELKSRKKGVQVYKENPFWEPQEVAVGQKRITVSGGTHITDEGEAIKHSGIHVVQDVDKEEFVKIFTKNVRTFFDLKPTTQRVLEYLLVQLQAVPGADSIHLAWFSAEEYFSEYNLKVSRASFHRALNEMLTKGFIAESQNPHEFWFNPHLFFNGNRMRFIKEFRVRDAEKVKDDAESQSPIRAGLAKTEKEKLEENGQQTIFNEGESNE